ncbi:hypothetical protein F1559_000013 [Cyanidiococcus yangmingshanensis]|uniref:Uncharacterized protein n=1 Tax=Cyanidiococcus yangmingshanensis TaxID=2690220 RepID=A0A7J7IK31_9RHOD|nr:hypothetical protein F1559_000013 [Cyanidiococcus yangmingshanensis]
MTHAFSFFLGVCLVALPQFGYWLLWLDRWSCRPFCFSIRSQFFFLLRLVAVSASPPRWNWFERSFVLVQWFAWLRLFVFLLQFGTFQQERGFVLATCMFFCSGLLDSGSR